MKVIKEGNPDRGKIFRGNCHGCRSKIEAHVNDDNLQVEHDIREGGSFAHVKCPVCDQPMVVYQVSDR